MSVFEPGLVPYSDGPLSALLVLVGVFVVGARYHLSLHRGKLGLSQMRELSDDKRANVAVGILDIAFLPPTHDGIIVDGQ